MDDERLASYYTRPHALVMLRTLLPFPTAPTIDHDGGANWIVESREAFRPRGLLIWNAPDGAVVEHIKIGVQGQLVAAVGAIPAQWFATAQSYEQVWDAHRRGIDPPGWGDFQIAAVAMLIQIRLTHPGRGVPHEEWQRVQLLMWGQSIR